jgi:hypothetical protein
VQAAASKGAHPTIKTQTFIKDFSQDFLSVD